jgi:hypothetical protein
MRKQKSLRQLAVELGVSHSYLSQVLHGRRPPSDRVAKALNGKQMVSNIEATTGLKIRFLQGSVGSSPSLGSESTPYKSKAQNVTNCVPTTSGVAQITKNSTFDIQAPGFLLSLELWHLDFVVENWGKSTGVVRDFLSSCD